jgi:hypothetical protein
VDEIAALVGSAESEHSSAELQAISTIDNEKMTIRANKRSIFSRICRLLALVYWLTGYRHDAEIST